MTQSVCVHVDIFRKSQSIVQVEKKGSMVIYVGGHAPVAVYRTICLKAFTLLLPTFWPIKLVSETKDLVCITRSKSSFETTQPFHILLGKYGDVDITFPPNIDVEFHD